MRRKVTLCSISFLACVSQIVIDGEEDHLANGELSNEGMWELISVQLILVPFFNRPLA